MGGVGTYLNIEPAELPEGKRRAAPRSLHRSINKSVKDTVWRQCGYGWLRQTADGYLSEEIADGYRDGLFEASESELSWIFKDHAGCCSGSSSACLHWYAVCLAALRDRYDRVCLSFLGNSRRYSPLESLERAWRRTGDERLQAACREAAAELRSGDWTIDAPPEGALARVITLLADPALLVVDAAGLCFRVAWRLRWT